MKNCIGILAQFLDLFLFYEKWNYASVKNKKSKNKLLLLPLPWTMFWLNIVYQCLRLFIYMLYVHGLTKYKRIEINLFSHVWMNVLWQENAQSVEWLIHWVFQIIGDLTLLIKWYLSVLDLVIKEQSSHSQPLCVFFIVQLYISQHNLDITYSFTIFKHTPVPS